MLANDYLRPETRLKDFQKLGVIRMLKEKRLVLGDATGLGKTLQIIAAYSYYKTKYKRAKLLFATDKSLVEQAEEEVHKFCTGLVTANMYNMDRLKRYKVYEKWLLGEVDVLVGTYGSLRDDILTASSLRVSMTAPKHDKGYKKYVKPYKGKYGFLSVSTKGKLGYKAITENVKIALGKTKMEIYDHFEIKTNDKKVIRVYASIKRMVEGKRRFVVQLHHEDGKGSERTTSTPFIDYFEEANKDSRLPLFSAWDEAAIFKDSDSRTHRMGAFLSRQSTRAVAITATVTKGELWEAYNVFKCIGITLMGREEFRSKFYVYTINYAIPKRKIRGKWVRPKELSGYKNISEFHKLIQPHYLGRAKKDVAKELPPFGSKRYLVEECAGVHAALTHLYTTAYMAERPASINQVRSALLTPQMYVPELGEDYLSSTAQQLIHTLNVRFSGEKIVIYVDLKQPLDILSTILPNHLPKHYRNQLKITGDISDRTKVKKTFINDPSYNILWINSAGLKGLNLHISGDLFPLMPPYTGGDFIQMAGRISRIGTEHTSLTLHKIILRDSASSDNELLVQSSLRLINSITPNSVDEGLIEPYFDDKVIQAKGDPEVYMRESFSNRKSRYLSKDILL